MKKAISVLIVGAVVAAGAFAADLSVKAQFDVTGKTSANNYLTVKGSGESVDMDTVDTTTGASKKKGTEVWNTYRTDAAKKNMLPGGFQSLVKYGVSPAAQYATDNLTVSQAKDGVITVMYAHRGTAYLMVTDKSGKFAIPGAVSQMRKIANLNADGTQTVGKDFSATGKSSDIDWAKVWNPSVKGGSVIMTVKDKEGKDVDVKTGELVYDNAAAAAPYTGTIQLTLKGNILTVEGTLR